ncbi:DUF4230 domain-containing protein [bacterium]|nr:DUF4230 domain-containing protein [bacterium]
MMMTTEAMVIIALLLGFFGCFALYSMWKSFIGGGSDYPGAQGYERCSGTQIYQFDVINCATLSNYLRSKLKIVAYEGDYYKKGIMDKYWLFSHKIMKVLYHGRITGGFNMTQLCVEKGAGGVFNIIIPRPEIFSNEVIERDVLLIKNGWWNKVTDEDRNTLEIDTKLNAEQEKYQELYNNSVRYLAFFINNIMDNLPNQVPYSVRVDGIPVNLNTGEQMKRIGNSKSPLKLPYRSEINERGLVRYSRR